MVSANRTSRSCSPKPIISSSGLATTTAKVRISAPKIPPTSEDVKAADRARAASPRFDIGKPSSTVACELLPPGIPISTDENVSAVGVTAIIPMIIGSASEGVHAEEKGKQHGHAGGAAHGRQYAEDQAEKDAEQQIDEMPACQQLDKGRRDNVEHAAPLTPRPCGPVLCTGPPCSLTP